MDGRAAVGSGGTGGGVGGIIDVGGRGECVADGDGSGVVRGEERGGGGGGTSFSCFCAQVALYTIVLLEKCRLLAGRRIRPTVV